MAITNSNTYSSDQLSQIDDLRNYVEEYCAANDIDPATYLSALDGNLTDNDLRDDPAFQAYWQLAYLQLVEILDPTMINSPDGDIGAVDFDSIYPAVSSEMNSFITTLLQDSPEMMAFAAQEAGQTESADSLLSLFSALNTTEESDSPTVRAMFNSAPGDDGSDGDDYGDDARALNDELDLGSGYTWLIETEEGIRSSEGSILEYMSEMDQQLVDLTEALNSGTISSEEFSSQAGQISLYRETLLGMMQQLESSLATIMEMYSKLIDKADEMNMAVINNLRSYS